MPRRALFSMLLAIAASAPADAQLTIPLETYANGPLRKVAVTIAGDTLDFLLDTGGGVTLISPALATRLGCEPSGRSHGYRMTGEHLEGPVCRDVPLSVGGYATRVEASVMDMMALLGDKAPPVHGMVSLRTFQGQLLTLDLPAQQLTLETPASLDRRVAAMTPVPVRLATGLEGGQLDAYIGVPAGDAELWLLWDSGNQGPTFLAPWSAKLLGIDPAGALEHPIRLGDQTVTVPVRVRELIHDGVLNARLVERARWTLDLKTGRLWVSDVAPLLSLPAEVTAPPAPPAEEAQGWYEVTLQVNGQAQPALLHVEGAAGSLRFVGEERVFTLNDVRAAENRLAFQLPMNRSYPVEITFTGYEGRGTWGDAQRGGAVSARKVR